jgi:hypothetical protein
MFCQPSGGHPGTAKPQDFLEAVWELQPSGLGLDTPCGHHIPRPGFSAGRVCGSGGGRLRPVPSGLLGPGMGMRSLWENPHAERSTGSKAVCLAPRATSTHHTLLPGMPERI